MTAVTRTQPRSKIHSLGNSTAVNFLVTNTLRNKFLLGQTIVTFVNVVLGQSLLIAHQYQNEVFFPHTKTKLEETEYRTV